MNIRVLLIVGNSYLEVRGAVALWGVLLQGHIATYKGHARLCLLLLEGPGVAPKSVTSRRTLVLIWNYGCNCSQGTYNCSCRETWTSKWKPHALTPPFIRSALGMMYTVIKLRHCAYTCSSLLVWFGLHVSVVPIFIHSLHKRVYVYIYIYVTICVACWYSDMRMHDMCTHPRTLKVLCATAIYIYIHTSI